MAISVADNFSYKGAKPLDARIQYATVANMKNATTSDLYDGCLAYVTETKKNYQYDSTNSVDPTTGKWRELQTGGGGGTSVEANVEEVATEDLHNIKIGDTVYAIPTNVEVDLVPRLTANDSAPLIGIASDSNPVSANFQPWHAFASVEEFNASTNGDYWATRSSNGYLQFAFENFVTITKVMYAVYNTCTFQIQYSEDGTNWTDGDSITRSRKAGSSQYICVAEETQLSAPVYCKYFRFKGTANTDQNIGAVHLIGFEGSGGGGEGGHTIEDNGTEMTQRDTLDFVDFDLEDDDINEKTVVQSHELTQEEFEEIFSSGLPGAITGFDMSNTTCEANIHSTDERVIGQWIDGKPLYQKSFTFTTGSSSNIDTIGTIANISTAVSIKGYLQLANATIALPWLYNTAVSSAAYAGAMVSGSDVKVMYGGSDYCNRPGSLTIQYTKTTDSAVASGEKIVGQWIDGKPIFRKSVSLGSETAFSHDSGADKTLTALGLPDSVDNIISIVGYNEAGSKTTKRRTSPMAVFWRNTTTLCIRSTSSVADFFTTLVVEYTKS